MLAPVIAGITTPDKKEIRVDCPGTELGEDWERKFGDLLGGIQSLEGAR